MFYADYSETSLWLTRLGSSCVWLSAYLGQMWHRREYRSGADLAAAEGAERRGILHLMNGFGANVLSYLTRWVV